MMKAGIRFIIYFSSIFQFVCQMLPAGWQFWQDAAGWQIPSSNAAI